MLFNNRLLRWVLIASCLLTACVISLHAEETPAPQAAPAPLDMTKAMQHSMDPNVWMQMMAIMMNPQNSSSLDACALCHEPQEIAEYQASFGPMLDMMWQPYKAMMNPHAMTSMMNPNTYMGSLGGMMNPAMYMNMMNPMMGMMNPAMYMNMMYPMMGMMGPMMGPMMGSMMNPMMGMMNPAMYMNMMNPMGNPMMNPMGMMPPMPTMPGYGGQSPQSPGSPQMDTEQHKQWYDQWTDMMKNFLPNSGSKSE